ncbi:MAG: hypothetical protein JWO38_3233 [Gemmataceae bacterium]|nr:hypothetical protein [Gemmataceae bacterium]
MSARLFLAAVVFAGLFGSLVAAPPDPKLWIGKVKWADKYPKTYAAAGGETGGVEVVGTYETPDGWEAKEVQVDYLPKTGGVVKTVKPVKLAAGKWGAIDDTTKKVIPAKVPLAPGPWTVRVLITYQRTVDGATERVPVMTSFAHVEVK